MLTSRARLGIAGEWLMPLAGLPVPDPDETEPDALRAFDAIRLFELRAQAASTSFAATDAVAEVAQLVRLLEGAPLAIELAAAWVRLLPVAEIRREIERSVDLLEGSADAPDRQRSVRASFEHSWRLLAPAEQRCLAQLSMFAAPFTREAAAHVADGRLPVLAALADKSLLRAHGDGRFSLHRLMQQCAKAKLVDASGVRRRHSEYFMRLLARIPLAEIGVAGTLEEIDGAFEDCRMAWRYGVETRAASALEQMAPTLLRFCEIRRRHIEGIALFGAAAQAFGDAAPLTTRAVVQRALGTLHYRNGDLKSASEAVRNAMRLYRSLRNQASLLQCLTVLGMIAWTRGEIAIAQRHFGEAIRRARAAGDDAACATVLNALANCARSLGKFDHAFALQQEALRLHEAVGNVTGQAVVLNDVGAMLRMLGRNGEAESALRRGLQLCEVHHLAVIREYCLYNLAMTQIELGQLKEARCNLQQAMQADQAAGVSLLSALLRLCRARICMRNGDAGAAPTLLHEALVMARALASVPTQLFAVSIVAEWLNRRAERDRAASLWSFLAAHPRNEAGDRTAARRALESLALTRGEARGVGRAARELELNSLVETLITDLGSRSTGPLDLPVGANAGPTPAQRPPV